MRSELRENTVASLPHIVGEARKPVRIFWLGMHKILVDTELVLLQQMGYEVFRPPYNTDVIDQSVSRSENFGNADLPPDVKQRLLKYNFFYNRIEPEIAQLLNAYFDLVLVTINPDWLKAVLAAYEGPVIYRCYGQIGTVSESLVHNGAKELIERRDSFYFLPHAQECLDSEQPWLRNYGTVIPYWLPSDVLKLVDTWGSHDHSRSIALSCPNVSNHYYRAHFKYLKKYFEERCFKYYGVQVDENDDFNVVGSLPREEQLACFVRESGYLYTYREPNVCYLPPIEMMILGGPVIYLPGSLLARYFDGRSPGLVRDEIHAVRTSKRLMSGDSVLIDEIVSSQDAVRYRYMPAYGEPIFREVIQSLVAEACSPAAPVGQASRHPAAYCKGVLLFAHMGGYVAKDGKFSAIHGIPRVMRQFVKALNDYGIRVSVTYAGEDRDALFGFYAAECRYPELVDAVDVSGRDAPQLNGELGADRYAYAIVPHYHLFPQANELTIPVLAYIPDYLPHFFYGRDWFIENENDVACGYSLAQKASRVLTNSQFSADYLPRCRLGVPAHKIVCFPLPYLGSADRTEPIPSGEAIAIGLLDFPFIFYPTQPHPNKRLDLLVLAWILVNEGSTVPVKLVLTAGALPETLQRLAAAEGLAEHICLLPGADDRTVEWLYSHAACLAFSSELEGNFPTQILEAAFLDCPIVCMDNPLITAELGEMSKFLAMTPFGDVERFAESIANAVRDRQSLLSRQRLIKSHLELKFSLARFRRNVLEVHDEMYNLTLTETTQ